MRPRLGQLQPQRLRQTRTWYGCNANWGHTNEPDVRSCSRCIPCDRPRRDSPYGDAHLRPLAVYRRPGQGGEPQSCSAGPHPCQPAATATGTRIKGGCRAGEAKKDGWGCAGTSPSDMQEDRGLYAGIPRGLGTSHEVRWRRGPSTGESFRDLVAHGAASW